MKKVYQKLVDPKRGDCMQAVYASLFNMELEEVPPFIDFGEDWMIKIREFLAEKGYKIKTVLYNGKNVMSEYHIERVKDYEGIDGLFYGVVNSPKFYLEGGTHAIIVDKDLNIVHDPNPGYAGVKDYPYAEELGHHGITCVEVIEKI